jgi:hypothetical protein
MIGEELSDDGSQERHEFTIDGWDSNLSVCFGYGYIRDDEDFAASGLDLMEGGAIALYKPIIRHQQDTDHMLIYQCERAMFEFACRICFGMDICYFFDLER